MKTLCPELIHQREFKPIGRMHTLKCWPWTFGNCFLFGDACHTMSPYSAQGINLALDGVYQFTKLLDENKGLSFKEVYDKYQNVQKDEAEACTDYSSVLQDFFLSSSIDSAFIFLQDLVYYL